MFERYRPYSGRLYSGIIGLLAVELLLWYFLYRPGGIEARWAAGLMGVWFAILILIALAQASIDVPINLWGVLPCAYMLLSHTSYAFLGSRARY